MRLCGAGFTCVVAGAGAGVGVGFCATCGVGAGCWSSAFPVAHAGRVASATTASAINPAQGKRSGARPFMIMTSLLSSTRRLLARTPTTAAIDAAGAAPSEDNASKDSAYARRPFGNAEMTQASHASSACSRSARRTDQNNGFHHHATPATSSIQPTMWSRRAMCASSCTISPSMQASLWSAEVRRPQQFRPAEAPHDGRCRARHRQHGHRRHSKLAGERRDPLLNRRICWKRPRHAACLTQKSDAFDRQQTHAARNPKRDEYRRCLQRGFAAGVAGQGR